MSLDFLLVRRLVHNLVSIIFNCHLDNLQKFEDNLHYFGLYVVTLTLFPTPNSQWLLSRFSFKTLVSK